MLKDLLKKELRQLWFATETLSAADTPWYTQAPASQPRMNGADDRSASVLGNGPSFWPSSRDILATARAASGM
jgi:hypothetical protein